MSGFLRTTLLWMAIAFVGEVVVGPAIRIFGVAPDFAVVAVVTLALAKGPTAGAVAGCCVGLVQDLATPQLLGLSALCKTLVGYGCGRIRGHLVYGLPAVEFGLTALAVFAHDLLGLVIENRFHAVGFLRPLFLQVLPGALYSGLVGLPILRLATRAGVLGRDE